MDQQRRHPFLRFYHPTPTPSFWLIYVLSVIFTYHISIVVYGASSYMEQFARPEVIGSLYTIGSAVAILCFLFIARILRKVGNSKLTLSLVFLQTASLILLGAGLSPALSIVSFVVFLVISPLLYLNIDIFSETLIGADESQTGTKRGLALSFMSIASAAGPLTLGILVGDDSSKLNLTFFLSALVLQLFTLLVLTRFRKFHDPAYKELRVLEALRSFWNTTNLRLSLLANFFLQMFFSWTVIFIPLYLATEVGLPWDAIGLILAVGLFAYVLIEYPAGVIADRYLGEKEMMATGFVIVAVTVSWISFMDNAPVTSWIILMFINRVGAALVETTNESYFFKQTVGSDVNIISFFRLMRPLATIVGSLLGSAALLFLPFKLVFIVFGFCMVPGAFFASRLEDTK